MTIKQLQKKSHSNAKAKGFWDGKVNIPEKLMLIVSEVSEAMEADREGKHLTKAQVKEFKKRNFENLSTLYRCTADEIFKSKFENVIKNKFGDELADIAIRLADLAEFLEIDLTWHIEQKQKYNKLRKKKHGKKY